MDFFSISIGMYRTEHTAPHFFFLPKRDVLTLDTPPKKSQSDA